MTEISEILNLTLSASGAKYKAPFEGRLDLKIQMENQNEHCVIYVPNKGNTGGLPDEDNILTCRIYVDKDDICTLEHNLTTFNVIKFAFTQA